MENMELQLEMEKLYSKNQLIPRIYKEFVDAGFKEILKEKGIDIPFGLSLLVQMVLHKRASLTTLVGVLHSKCQSLQHCADSLYKAAESDLVTWNEPRQEFIIIYDIDAQVQKEIDTYQYPLPLVVKPKKVKTNKDTGYYLGNGSIILKNNHHDEDVNLEHINRMNSIHLRLNVDVLAHVKNRWKYIDKPKPNETLQEFKKRQKAFDKYNETSTEVIEGILINDEGFYLTHKYDKRGRIYCQGYHCSYQGNDYNKACVEFYDGEKLPPE